MKSSSCRGLEVFDFKEEDELPEVSAGEYLGKFKTTNVDDLALKYDFLKYAVAPVSNILRTETGGMPCVDVDELDADHCKDNCTSKTDLGTDGAEYATTLSGQRVDSIMQFGPLDNGRQNSYRDNNEGCRNLFPKLEMRTSSPGAPSPIKSQSDHAVSESLSNESVDRNSNANDDGIDEQASSSFTSDNGEDVLSNGQDTKDHARDVESDYMNGFVLVFPEYAIYRENYYAEPRISFSSRSVKIEASSICRKEKKHTLEWAVDDVVKIHCHWLQNVRTVYLGIHVISKDGACDDCTCGSAGIEELKFAVVDPNWFEKQEMIRTFNVKYSSVLDVITDAGWGMERIDSSGHRPYFPTFDDPFEDFIYPKGDSDAVSISKRDVDLLQPETFINDTIIDFYIKYLKNRIQLEEKHRFHFFNSFFFRKLADLDKDPSSAADGRAAFLRVRKWTRKINLFEKDYIFIPVNFNLHWSLIVICHPGEVASISEEKISTLSKVPCILHMDSIKGSHAGLKNLVQSYLWEEWKEKGNEISEDTSQKFSNFRFVSLELPQQENSYDCGIFLLHYLELFLQEAPQTFNPFRLSKRSKFLNVDWFPPFEASLKRSIIQKLIYELLEGHSGGVSGAASSKENKSSKIPEYKNENGLGVDNISGKCSSVIACSSASPGGKGIEVGLLTDPKSSQNVTDSGLVLREFLEAGAAVDSFPGPCQSLIQPSYYHLNGAATTNKAEDAEMDEQIAFVPESTGPSVESEFREFSNLTTQAEGVSYPSGCFESKASREHKISLQEQHKGVHSPETSICVSDNSQDEGMFKNNLAKEDSNQSKKCEMDGKRSRQVEKVEDLLENLAPPSGEVCEDAIMDVSQDYDEMCDDNGRESGNTGCCRERQPMLHQDSNLSESTLRPDGGDLGYGLSDDMNMANPSLQQSANITGIVEIALDAIAISDDQEEPEEQRDAKRPRLTHIQENAVGIKETTKDICL